MRASIFPLLVQRPIWTVTLTNAPPSPPVHRLSWTFKHTHTHLLLPIDPAGHWHWYSCLCVPLSTDPSGQWHSHLHTHLLSIDPSRHWHWCTCTPIFPSPQTELDIGTDTRAPVSPVHRPSWTLAPILMPLCLPVHRPSWTCWPQTWCRNCGRRWHGGGRCCRSSSSSSGSRCRSLPRRASRATASSPPSWAPCWATGPSASSPSDRSSPLTWMRRPSGRCRSRTLRWDGREHAHLPLVCQRMTDTKNLDFCHYWDLGMWGEAFGCWRWCWSMFACAYCTSCILGVVTQSSLQFQYHYQILLIQKLSLCLYVWCCLLNCCLCSQLVFVW